MKSLWLLLLSATAASGQGTILWNESVNGPLSNDPGNPTSLGIIQLGTNTLIGSAEFVPIDGGPGGNLYSDIITFTVNGGFQITSLILQTDSSIGVWIGNSGFTSELASIISPSNGDILPQLNLQNISPGTYGFYVSDRQFGSSPTVANYQLDFIVQAVPEPSAISLLLIGAGFVLLQRRRQPGH